MVVDHTTAFGQSSMAGLFDSQSAPSQGQFGTSSDPSRRNLFVNPRNTTDSCTRTSQFSFKPAVTEANSTSTDPSHQEHYAWGQSSTSRLFGSPSASSQGQFGTFTYPPRINLFANPVTTTDSSTRTPQFISFKPAVLTEANSTSTDPSHQQHFDCEQPSKATPFGPQSSSSKFGTFASPATRNPFANPATSMTDSPTRTSPFVFKPAVIEANSISANSSHQEHFDTSRNNSLFGDTTTGLFGKPTTTSDSSKSSLQFGFQPGFTPMNSSSSNSFPNVWKLPPFGMPYTPASGFRPSPSQNFPFGTFQQAQPTSGSNPWSLTTFPGSFNQPALCLQLPQLVLPQAPLISMPQQFPQQSSPQPGLQQIRCSVVLDFCFPVPQISESQSCPSGFAQQFSTQNSLHGNQTADATPPSNGSRFSQPAFSTHQEGSRLATYKSTPVNDISNTVINLQSISSMPVYEEKSHEELRYEDYCRGDKGDHSFSANMSSYQSRQNAFEFPKPPSFNDPFSSLRNSAASKFPPTDPSGLNKTNLSGFCCMLPISASSSSPGVKIDTPPATTDGPYGEFGWKPPGNQTADATPPSNGSRFSRPAYSTQQEGSRLATYKSTPVTDVSGTVLNLQSISSMPVYKEKSHEELRYEDCRHGDKGVITENEVSEVAESRENCERSFSASEPVNPFHSSTVESSSRFGCPYSQGKKRFGCPFTLQLPKSSSSISDPFSSLTTSKASIFPTSNPSGFDQTTLSGFCGFCSTPQTSLASSSVKIATTKATAAVPSGEFGWKPPGDRSFTASAPISPFHSSTVELSSRFGPSITFELPKSSRFVSDPFSSNGNSKASSHLGVLPPGPLFSHALNVTDPQITDVPSVGLGSKPSASLQGSERTYGSLNENSSEID